MLYISDFREGDHVSGIYLCKSKINAKTKVGKTYYSLSLQDKSGTCDGKIWDLSSGIDHFEPMDYIQVEAEVVLYQGANQLNIRRCIDDFLRALYSDNFTYNNNLNIIFNNWVINIIYLY